jgi:hypothetical protein
MLFVTLSFRIRVLMMKQTAKKVSRYKTAFISAGIIGFALLVLVLTTICSRYPKTWMFLLLYTKKLT